MRAERDLLRPGRSRNTLAVYGTNKIQKYRNKKKYIYCNSFTWRNLKYPTARVAQQTTRNKFRKSASESESESESESASETDTEIITYVLPDEIS